MQFKHPEILWALLLLLIPIFIHLFQLRRFKKTPFTNVAMLQKVVSEARKSNQIKKWLLLMTRLGLLAALVIAFAQPFAAKKTALSPKQTIIYLDNSFSMQAKKDGMALLEGAVQELAKSIDDNAVFTLFTNDRTFRETRLKNVQNDLLSLRYSKNQLDTDAIRLKANSLFNKDESTVKQLIYISDFQNRVLKPDSLLNFEEYYIALQADEISNVSIDSLSITENNAAQSLVNVMVSGVGLENSVPISLYDGQNLIAKSSVSFEEGSQANVEFSIPSKQNISGRISVQDKGLVYDNTFYFNIDKKNRVNVLAIVEPDDSYLKRLFSEEEFNLTSTKLNQLDYSKIDRQNLIILDGLQQIPNSLQQVLKSFYDSGGNIILIPSNAANLSSYNQFLSSLSQITLNGLVNNPEKINNIAFDHPLYRNVFEKRVSNFQSPEVKAHYPTNANGSSVLGYTNGAPFLLNSERLYVFTASIESENSNFKNSPLIVPTFYNMATMSLKNAKPYFRIGSPASLDISAALGQDNILSFAKENKELIPRQQSFSNKTTLFIDENIDEDGIYQVKDKDSIYRLISFNYPRMESNLRFTQIANASSDIGSLLDQLRAASEVSPYWKWFVILALIFVLLEILIQKFVS